VRAFLLPLSAVFPQHRVFCFLGRNPLVLLRSNSTTVGFGDIYLPAEVFMYRDLLTFPLMWLVGFVLVAAFIAKFADTWITLFGKRSYVVDVLERLHKTHMLHDLPSAGEVVSERWRKRLTSCCPRRTDVGNAARPATGTEAPDGD
jgi:hypothetical protein